MILPPLVFPGQGHDTWKTLKGSGLTRKYQTGLESLSRGKLTSLFGFFVSDKEKSFIRVTPSVNLTQLFSFVTDAQSV